MYIDQYLNMKTFFSEYIKFFLTHCVWFRRLYMQIASFLKQKFPVVLEWARSVLIILMKEYEGKQQWRHVMESGRQHTSWERGHVEMNSQDVTEMGDLSIHDDIIKWKNFPRYRPFARGIHRSPVNFPYNGQWRGALMFSLICAWINGWVNNREAGDLRHHLAHYDFSVMYCDVTAASSGLFYSGS